jgi:putative copper export protein
MFWFYYTSVSVHVLAAMAWLGGMLFLGLVGAPALRSVEPPQLRQALFRDIGMRFRGLGWTAISILVVTGVLNLYARGLLPSLGSRAFWSTTFGRALAVKLFAVATMIAISAFHDFVHGPRASQHPAGTPAAIAARRRAMVLARVNALVGVIVVLAAVRLARA